ncbi:hypothetical protein DPMN_151228 [Dreissena polymorpha]|uniref:Uncharacterized protein n=1 Tax=Dreissena polymorpha TaxID=45954 RepID=A0A9D4J6A4_DREPO|nr:hypothetical protein DPMN_151228 [Dreissena polymorpha]
MGPFHHPLIDPRYLTDERNVDTYLREKRVCEKYLSTQSMEKIWATVKPTIRLQESRVPIIRLLEVHIAQCNVHRPLSGRHLHTEAPGRSDNSCRPICASWY